MFGGASANAGAPPGEFFIAMFFSKIQEQAMNDDPKPKQRVFSAEKTRQGEIILRTRTRRIIFIAGLIGFVVLVALLQFATSS